MKAETEFKGYPTVVRWLSRLAPSSHKGMSFHFYKWLRWVNVNSPKFSEFTPDDFVRYRKDGNGERFEVLDLIQTYIGTLEGTQGYKSTVYSNIRSFFRHNRVELPQDSTFTVRGERPKVQGTLTADEIKQLVLSCTKCYRALYLCMFQGGLGKAELVFWSNNGWSQLKEDLKQDHDVIKIQLPGRKKAANIRPYYTLIGGDAIEALRIWVKVRPVTAEAIFTNQFGEGISKNSISKYWNRHMKRIGLYREDPTQGLGIRYGKNLHEIRDVYRSLYAKSGRAPEVVEFLMGHKVDRLEYNKAHLDDSWVLKEYKRALPMLQIMSSGRPFGQVEEDEIINLQETVNNLQSRLERSTQELDKRERAFSDLEAQVKTVLPDMQARVNELSKKINEGNEEEDPSSLENKLDQVLEHLKRLKVDEGMKKLGEKFAEELMEIRQS